MSVKLWISLQILFNFYKHYNIYLYKNLISLWPEPPPPPKKLDLKIGAVILGKCCGNHSLKDFHKLKCCVLLLADRKSILALYLLPSLLCPTMNVLPGSKRKWKPSISESRTSFIDLQKVLAVYCIIIIINNNNNNNNYYYYYYYLL